MFNDTFRYRHWLCALFIESVVTDIVSQTWCHTLIPDTFPFRHINDCFFVFSPSEPETKCGGVHSRPLDSDDLRMIEEDLSKQLGSSPRDREWEDEPQLESYVTSLENGGKESTSLLSELHQNLRRPGVFNKATCCGLMYKSLKCCIET